MASERDQTIPMPRTPATWSLVLMNILIAAAMASVGVSPLLAQVDGLVAFGALSARETWSGEVWRLLTAMFVHGGLWHVGLNMWVLAHVGRALETAVGTSRFVLIYLASGVFGFALSLTLHPGVSAGASGAIFGVVGGLLGIAYHTRGLTVGRAIVATLLPFVVGTLALGFLIPFVDNSAHAGGLIMGALLGFALSTDVKLEGVKLSESRASLDKRLGLGALVVGLIAFAVLVPLSLRPTFSPTWAVTMAVDALRRDDVAEAMALSERATRLAPQDGAVLALTARLKEQPTKGAKDDVNGALLQAARARAAPFYAEAIVAFDDERADRALSNALLTLGRGSDPRLFVIVDEKMTRGLCEAALARTREAPVPEVLNNCAWFFVNAQLSNDDDHARALVLAERAVALVLGERDPTTLSALEKVTAAAYLHTLAEARLRAGDADDARATLEKVIALALSDDPFYAEELDRLRRAARRVPATSAPETSDPEPASVDTDAETGSLAPARDDVGMADTGGPVEPALSDAAPGRAP
jgi:membrane associated rhomboid family serine protease/tetratricopeptide (TPR) repeat protein